MILLLYRKICSSTIPFYWVNIYIICFILYFLFLLIIVKLVAIQCQTFQKYTTLMDMIVIWYMKNSGLIFMVHSQNKRFDFIRFQIKFSNYTNCITTLSQPHFSVTKYLYVTHRIKRYLKVSKEHIEM